MSKIRNILRSRFGFAVISNTICVLVAFWLYRPFFEENDDVGIALLAEGAYGNCEPHLIYSNFVYGKILCFLQQMMPALRWHSVIMLVFSFIAMTGLVYVLAKDQKGRVISCIILVASFYELYVSFQFSKVAAVITICSYMMLFETIRSEMTLRSRSVITCIATLSIFFAIIIRVDSFYLSTMIAGLYGICLVCSDLISHRFISKVRSYCISFIPVFIILCVCVLYDKKAYTQDGWPEFMEYYESIQQMVDFHSASLIYDLHGNELADLGVSENDALMFITYEMLDSDPATWELMDKIAGLDPKGMTYINIAFFKSWIANIYEELFSMNGVIVGLIFIIGMLVSCRANPGLKRFNYISIIIQAFICFGVLFYYQYSGRWCHRVVYALFLVELIFFAYLLSSSDASVNEKPLKTCIFAFLFVCAVYLRLGNEFDYQEDKRSSWDYNELISYMKENKDCLFVADVFTMVGYGKYDIFNASEKGQFDNCLLPDSVLISNTPFSKAIANNYGYKDPFDSLSSRDEKVILADSLSPEVELIYCNEHGDGHGYDLVKIDTAGNIPLYNIR